MYSWGPFVHTGCLISLCRAVINLHAGLPVPPDNKTGDVFFLSVPHTHSHTHRRSCIEEPTELCEISRLNFGICWLSLIRRHPAILEDLASWPGQHLATNTDCVVLPFAEHTHPHTHTHKHTKKPLPPTETVNVKPQKKLSKQLT